RGALHALPTRALPISGETNIGMTTLSRTPPQMTSVPPASAAPTMPPNSAWEEEDGRPKYQVTRFQMIAPTSAAKRMPIPLSPCRSEEHTSELQSRENL